MGNEASTEANNLPPIENDLNIKWQGLQSANSPHAREGLASGVIGDKIYVFGGGAATDSGPMQFNDLHCYDTTNNTWTPLTQFTSGSLPKSRTGSASAVINGSLYIFGGLSDQDGWINDLHIYNPATNAWTNDITTTGTAPTPRDKHSAVAIGSHLYVFGGFGPQQPPEQPEDEEEDDEDEEEDEPATFGWFNDLHILDTQSLAWTKVEVQNAEIPTPRAAFGMSTVGSTIYIFGGRDTSARQSDLYSFDTTTSTWKKLTPLGSRPSSRSFQTLSVVGSKLVVVGGLSQSNVHLNDVHIFDTVSNAWVQPKTVDGVIPPRGFHAAKVVGTRLFVFAGGADYDASIQENKTYRNDLWSLDTTPINDAKFEIKSDS